MSCSRCGAALAPGATFCSRCGQYATGVGPALSMARPGVITLLGVLHFIATGLFTLAALACLFALLGGSKEGGVLLVAFMICLFAAVLQLAAGIGLWRLRSWGRTLQMVLSCLGLLGFPLGTIINGLILYYITRPGVVALFSEKGANQLSPSERQAIMEMQSSGSGVAIALIVIVVGGFFVFGILAAIAVPNLMTAVERAKQKRSMADMQSIASALESYNAVHRSYPKTDKIGDVATALIPEYVKSLPTKDGWGSDFRYECFERNYSGQCDYFALTSSGKDKRFTFEQLHDYAGVDTLTTNFDCDVIYSEGEFLVRPNGLK